MKVTLKKYEVLNEVFIHAEGMAEPDEIQQIRETINSFLDKVAAGISRKGVRA